MYAYKIIVLLGALWTESVDAETTGELAVQSKYIYQTETECLNGMWEKLYFIRQQHIDRITKDGKGGVRDMYCVYGGVPRKKPA